MSMFQKRHYKAIAKALHAVPDDVRGTATYSLIRMFEEDNRLFDRDKFINAVKGGKQ